MAAFLDVGTFAAWAKRPDWDSELAAMLLDVVADWIRDRKPDLAGDDQAAQIVSFEVTRDTLMYGDLGPFKQGEKRTAHSSRSYALDRAVIEKFITDRHRRMLGVSLRAAPRGHFPKCDY